MSVCECGTHFCCSPRLALMTNKKLRPPCFVSPRYFRPLGTTKRERGSRLAVAVCTVRTYSSGRVMSKIFPERTVSGGPSLTAGNDKNRQHTYLVTFANLALRIPSIINRRSFSLTRLRGMGRTLLIHDGRAKKRCPQLIIGLMSEP